MSKLVMVIAMLLYQAQPIVGVVLCEQHRAVAEHDCGHDTDHQGSTSHPSHQPQDQGSADHCASSAACTSVARVVVTETLPFFSADYLTDVTPTAGTSAPTEWLRSAPFHPPKA